MLNRPCTQDSHLHHAQILERTYDSRNAHLLHVASCFTYIRTHHTRARTTFYFASDMLMCECIVFVWRISGSLSGDFLVRESKGKQALSLVNAKRKVAHHAISAASTAGKRFCLWATHSLLPYAFASAPTLAPPLAFYNYCCRNCCCLQDYRTYLSTGSHS